MGVGHRKEMFPVRRPPGQVGAPTGDQVILARAAIPLQVAPKLVGVAPPFPTEISGKPLGTVGMTALLDVVGVDVIERHRCCSLFYGIARLCLRGLRKSVASGGTIPLAPPEPHPAVHRWAAARHSPNPCSRAASCS